MAKAPPVVSDRSAMPEPTTLPSVLASMSSRVAESWARSSATVSQRSPGTTAILTERHASKSSSVTHGVSSMD